MAKITMPKLSVGHYYIPHITPIDLLQRQRALASGADCLADVMAQLAVELEEQGKMSGYMPRHERARLVKSLKQTSTILTNVAGTLQVTSDLTEGVAHILPKGVKINDVVEDGK